jgi:hypothetical protein
MVGKENNNDDLNDAITVVVSPVESIYIYELCHTHDFCS